MAAQTPQETVGVARRRGKRRKLDWARVADIDLPIDATLMLAAIGLSICSVVALGGSTDGKPLRQAIFAGIGLTLAAFISRLDYTRFFELRWKMYIGIIIAIVVVFLFSSEVNGAHLSLTLGPVSFQASELGKVIVAFVGATYIVGNANEVHTWRTTLGLLGVVMLPAVLTVDFGTSAVYGAIAFGLLLIGGTPGRHLAVLGVSLSVLVVTIFGILPSAGIHVLKDYQEARVTSFLTPNATSKAAQKEAYQVKQSLNALGSGRKTGRGEDAGLTDQGYLPFWPTDFIFSATGERFGFMGVAFVLSLFALIMWRGLRILQASRDFFGAVLAAGILLMLLFQVLVNAGMNVGIMPITGIPLPLMSYGGSSVISTYIAIGLLQAIYAQGRKSRGRSGFVAGTE